MTAFAAVLGVLLPMIGVRHLLGVPIVDGLPIGQALPLGT
jgi:hypothetical protein